VLSDGFTVAGSKLKFLMFESLDSTNNITIATPASNQFPLIQAASQSLKVLMPGDIFMFYIKAGSSALTTGSNDALALTASASTPTCQITALYGP